MLLTLSTTHEPATDLGFLLHKHPDRVQRFDVGPGVAHVFYPEATVQRCTCALLLEIDPVGLVRREGGVALAEYVNDRPYVASSLLAVALGAVFKSAMNGTCQGHETLAATPLPLRAELPVVPARGGEPLVRRLLEPLGYDVAAAPVALDPERPEWGDSRHLGLTVTGTVRLADLLTHLYVLLPVLDDDKHYWVDGTEVDKLLRRGAGWLERHPERELITRRALKGQGALVRPALARLRELVPDDDGAEMEETLEERVSLRDQRHGTVLAALEATGARTVLDLGCGPGALLKRLVRDPRYTRITGADVSVRALEQAARRLGLDELHAAQRERIALLHSALTYRDERLRDHDAAVLMEVVEHLDPPRLAALEHNVFGSARPRAVLVTTPNAEYNVRWPTLPAGRFRHPDHRFEWTRGEFAAWAGAVAGRHGYDVRHVPVGPEDATVGAPTQLAVFER